MNSNRLHGTPDFQEVQTQALIALMGRLGLIRQAMNSLGRISLVKTYLSGNTMLVARKVA